MNIIPLWIIFCLTAYAFWHYVNKEKSAIIIIWAVGMLLMTSTIKAEEMQQVIIPQYEDGIYIGYCKPEVPKDKLWLRIFVNCDGTFPLGTEDKAAYKKLLAMHERNRK